ncbi:DsbA family protein [Sphingorhabdus sp. IMCC26285]|uniref:DsbA family protein n=1 Tax=Sphingorhabdus profundilacus TaxID=2509718 RepID=A0A6I4LUZ5_9SPHN|nr:DsbA family protein [Sphingorhabdus profundilacus]MVZ97182.1 DsbA family protein [Sphingorhabdus profundilacus]
MNDIAQNSRIPIYLTALALAALALAGAYIFWQHSPEADNGQVGQNARQASTAADAAVAAAGMSDAQRKATEALVRAYILDNPEIITEAVEILQQRETAKRLTSVQKEIATPFPGAESGNPKGDITIVEFTDYSCGFCRASVADVKRLLTDDPQIRLIYRELPILSPASREAAAWALAAARQGKHQAFHDAMFAAGPPNAQRIRAAASKAGLNLSAAENFVASAQAKREIESNLSIMQQVGFNGTPTFIIGDQILEGALGYEALKAAVKKARDQG